MLKIIFEFVGGPNDGKVLQGALGDASDAERYYLFTNRGSVGQRLKVASDYAVEALAQEHLNEETRHQFQHHYYVVTDRLEENSEVIVRAEYDEKHSNPRGETLIRKHLEPASKAGESLEARIGNYLERTKKSLAEAYSHCWPAAAEPEVAATDATLAMHFSHVLLAEHFSVFAQAIHPTPAHRTVDVLGIAPGQDWFIAAALRRVHSASQFDALLTDVQQLQSFWLHSGLSIQPGAEHISRVAQHCGAGYGLLSGLHWLAHDKDSSQLLRLWTGEDDPGSFASLLLERTSGLNVELIEPIRVQHYEGHGTSYLLAAFFQIPRDS